jgi:hypothetical protein
MAKGMERLRFMQGNWDVEAHVMGDTGDWIGIPLPNTTTILPMLNGVCHREEMPVSVDGAMTRFFFSWSYDPYREIFRMISCDDTTGLMGVMEGDFLPGSDTVVVSDVNSGTAMLNGAGQISVCRRLISSKTSTDGFIDIVSESYDGGCVWQPVFRAIHTRMPT